MAKDQDKPKGSILPLALRCIFYSGILIASLVGACALGIAVQKMYENQCPLTMTYDNGSFDFGKKENCNFSIFVYVAGIVATFVFGLVTLINACKRNVAASSFVLIEVIFAGLAVLFYFVASIIVSVGFSNLCKSLPGSGTCFDTLKSNDSYGISDLYARLKATEGASWFCTVAWLLLTIFLLIRFRSARAAAQRAPQPMDNQEDDKKELTPPGYGEPAPQYTP